MEMMTLLNADCIDALKSIPDNSVGSIICDPPYGTTSIKWDSVIPFDVLWPELKRVRKPYAPIILFASQPFTTFLINSNIDEFKYCLVWEKTKAANFPQAPNMPLRKHEDIVVFSDGIVGHSTQTAKRMTYNPQGTFTVNITKKRRKVDDPHGFQRKAEIEGYQQTVGNYPGSVLKFGNVHNPKHPTQKPEELMEWLVNSYSNVGDTVLDFCMGSGTTGVAALKHGRKFIGIEKDATYFKNAQSRLDDTLRLTEFTTLE